MLLRRSDASDPIFFEGIPRSGDGAIDLPDRGLATVVAARGRFRPRSDPRDKSLDDDGGGTRVAEAAAVACFSRTDVESVSDALGWWGAKVEEDEVGVEGVVEEREAAIGVEGKPEEEEEGDGGESWWSRRWRSSLS